MRSSNMLRASCGLMYILVTVFQAEAYYGVTPENSSECTNDCVKDTMKDVSKLCFNTTLSDAWDVFTQDRVLDCTSIRKVLTILGSCENCGSLGGSFMWRDCHEKQRLACSPGQYCGTYCKAVKERGVTSCIDKKSDSQFFTNPTNALPDQQTDPTVSPDAAAKKDKSCDACASDKVSPGTAALLFVLGLALGAMVMAVLCFCVPCCNRWSSKTRTKFHSKFPHLKDMDNTQVDTSTVSASSTAPNGNNVTTTGLSSPIYRAGYHTIIANKQNPGDSHTYTGIQPESYDQGEIYTEPTGIDGTYQEPENGPTKGVKAVQSPVYNQFTNGDTVPSARPAPSAPSAYQSLKTYRDTESPHKYGIINSNSQFKFENSNSNEPIKSPPSNEGANDDCLDIEPQSDNQIPTSTEANVDHSYFVLEKGASQVDLVASVNENIDLPEGPKHDYFVLEKQ